MNKFQLLYIPLLSASLLLACDEGGNKQNTTVEDNTTSPAVPQAELPETEIAAPAATEAAGVDQAADPDLTQVEVVAANLQFSPSEIKAKPGERLQITLVNNGDVPYSIKFDLPNGEQELREPVPPGRKAALIFTAPEKAGTYAFYSPMTNQRGRGVTGSLVVEK